MLIDNLKNINSVADLFQYIVNVETELEEVKRHRDQLLIINDSLINKNMELEKLLAETEHTLEVYESKAVPKENYND